MSTNFTLLLSRATGLFALSRWLTRNRLRILCYHGIWFLDDHYGNHLFMSPGKFRARMEWLKNSGYSVISLEQAVSHLSASRIPPYTTVITIDDGWYGTYAYMLPALEQRGLPATLYVYTGAVDAQKPLAKVLLAALVQLSSRNELNIINPVTSQKLDYHLDSSAGKTECVEQVLDILVNLHDEEVDSFSRLISEKLGFDYDRVLASRQFGFMTYDEISQAEKRCLDIQLHTHSHDLDRDRPEQIETEIAVNRKKLAPHVRSSLEHFCYPDGVHSPGMHGYLEKNGIKSAVLVDTGLVARQSHVYSLKRILDGENISQLQFEAEMSGFLELIRMAMNPAKSLRSRFLPGQASE